MTVDENHLNNRLACNDLWGLQRIQRLQKIRLHYSLLQRSLWHGTALVNSSRHELEMQTLKGLTPKLGRSMSFLGASIQQKLDISTFFILKHFQIGCNIKLRWLLLEFFFYLFKTKKQTEKKCIISCAADDFPAKDRHYQTHTEFRTANITALVNWAFLMNHCCRGIL